ncbi:14373_t:CDS:2 [Entrophospora sp. SA101]|nr:14373_t:CDS:2 [Entrophospora sp. SA101]
MLNQQKHHRKTVNENWFHDYTWLEKDEEILNKLFYFMVLVIPGIQNNQKPQNDTVEPIVEVIGSPIIKELLQNPFIVDNKQDNV